MKNFIFCAVDIENVNAKFFNTLALNSFFALVPSIEMILAQRCTVMCSCVDINFNSIEFVSIHSITIITSICRISSICRITTMPA